MGPCGPMEELIYQWAHTLPPMITYRNNYKQIVKPKANKIQTYSLPRFGEKQNRAIGKAGGQGVVADGSQP